jgi:hypothetical protein
MAPGTRYVECNEYLERTQPTKTVEPEEFTRMQTFGPWLIDNETHPRGLCRHCWHFRQPLRRWRTKPSSPSTLFRFSTGAVASCCVSIVDAVAWWGSLESPIRRVDERTGGM